MIPDWYKLEPKTPSTSLSWQINNFGDTRVSVAISVKKARRKISNEQVFISMEEMKDPSLFNKFSSPDFQNLAPLISHYDPGRKYSKDHEVSRISERADQEEDKVS